MHQTPFHISAAAVFFGLAAHLYELGLNSVALLAALLGGVGSLLLGLAAAFKELRLWKDQE